MEVKEVKLSPRKLHDEVLITKKYVFWIPL